MNCKTAFTTKLEKTFRPKRFGLLRFESGKKATGPITVHISHVRGRLTQQNRRTLRETTNITQVICKCLGFLYVRSPLCECHALRKIIFDLSFLIIFVSHNLDWHLYYGRFQQHQAHWPEPLLQHLHSSGLVQQNRSFLPSHWSCQLLHLPQQNRPVADKH